MIGRYPIIRQYAVCGSMFTVDHAMIVIQRHNEIRDLQAELLDMVCYDVQVEPALQPITGEKLARGLTKPLMHALTSTVGVSGNYRGLHFSI